MKLSLRWKLILLVTALVTAAHLITGFFIAQRVRASMDREYDHLAMKAADNLARLSTAPMISNDLLAMRDLIHATMEQGYFTEAMLLDPSGLVLMHNQINKVGYTLADDRSRWAAQTVVPMISDHYQGGDGKQLSDVAVPIMVADSRVGTAVLTCSHQRITEQFLYLRQHILLIMAIGILVSTLCAIFAASYIIEPLRRLTNTAEEIAVGTFSEKLLPVNGNDEIATLTKAFNTMTVKIEDMVCNDQLTGIYNRQMFRRRIAEEFARCRRYQRPLAVLMIDVDRFKAVNDLYGHMVGDRILVEIAQQLQESVRSDDFIARYGGEEFVVVAPNTTAEMAAILAERIRSDIAKRPFSIADAKASDNPFVLLTNKTHPLTVSIGVANLTDAIQTEEELLEAADLVLFAAKRSGRNRVRFAHSPKTA